VLQSAMCMHKHFYLYSYFRSRARASNHHPSCSAFFNISTLLTMITAMRRSTCD